MIALGLRSDLHAEGNIRTDRLTIGKRCLERLTSRQQELYGWLAKEPTDYVDHPQFGAPDAESRIMDPAELAGQEPIQRFIQAFADPIGELGECDIPRGTILTASQERALFRQYNYCRYRMARISRGSGRTATLAQLRELLTWYAKVLEVRDML
ncbi:MAG: hypothetical protein PHU85_09875, partial [Phycisphaerae bacterium]|nr:hypothetical protein [Phycisphaerae bacterium]